MHLLVKPHWERFFESLRLPLRWVSSQRMYPKPFPFSGRGFFYIETEVAEVNLEDAPASGMFVGNPAISLSHLQAKGPP